MGNYVKSPEWEVLESRAIYTEVKYPCCPEPYPDISFYIWIERQPAFYNYILILPCFLLSSLTLVLFWLPPDSPAKMVLGMNIFVAFFLLLLLLEDTTPSASSTFPLIGTYYCLNMAIITLSTFLCVIVVNFHFRGDNKREVPFWMKKLVIQHGARLLFVTVGSIKEHQKPQDQRRKFPEFSIKTQENEPLSKSAASTDFHEIIRSQHVDSADVFVNPGYPFSRTSSIRGQAASHSRKSRLKSCDPQKFSHSMDSESHFFGTSLDESSVWEQRGNFPSTITLETKLDTSLPSGASIKPKLLRHTSEIEQGTKLQKRTIPRTVRLEKPVRNHALTELPNDHPAMKRRDQIVNDVQDIVKGLRYIQKVNDNKEKINRIVSEWRMVGMVLDRLFFFSYVITITLSILFYFPKSGKDVIVGDVNNVS